MKRELIMAAAVSAVLVGCNLESSTETAASAAAPIALDSEEKRISYGMGAGLGDRIKRESFGVDVEAFAQGMRDALSGAERLMSQEEVMQEMQAFQQKQMAKMQAEQDAMAEKNLQESEAFLADNGAKDGVVTTESGLQYKVVEAGDGAIPTIDDTVEVHYRGTLIDGTEFDSSYARGETVTFPVSGVIPGWTEALQLMSVGSKWQLAIPSDLAYGPGGTGGGPIGPNAALVFDVELLAIKSGEEHSGH